ncbi:MAG TPA: hypothetical protein VGK75_10385 [Casimicrobiaceae bacterium]|jgi:hypothetical protein
MTAKQRTTTTITAARLAVLRDTLEELEHLASATANLLQRLRAQTELTPELASLIAIGGQLSALSSAAIIAAWGQEKGALAT